MRKLITLTTFLGLVATVRAQSTLVQEAYLKASNPGFFDQHGWSVDIDGDTAIVGARGEDSDAVIVNGDENNDNSPQSGAAYVYVRNGTDWTQQAYLKAPVHVPGRMLGWDVAVHGDVAAISEVGSPSGIVQIYARTGTTWSHQATLSPPGGGDNPAFARSIDLTDDYIVVGQNEDPGIGCAHVFARTGTNWTFEATLKAPFGGAGDRFGIAVSASGDTVVCAARDEGSSATTINGDMTDNSAPLTGAVYQYRRTGTMWTFENYLKTGLATNFSGFGADVSLHGDTLVVGIEGDSSDASGINDDPNQGNLFHSGAAIVFERVGSSWMETTYLKASNPGDFDVFGHVVATNGTHILIGAQFQPGSGAGINGTQALSGSQDSGATYLFERSGSTWVQSAYIKAANADANDTFGESVAMTTSRFIVGASWESSDSAGVNGDAINDNLFRAGAAYVFDLAATIPSTETGTSSCNGDGGDQMGCVNCPCGNNASPGTIGGCLNSTGASARLSATGDTSVSLRYAAYTDLRFELAQAFPDTFCVLLSGDALAPQNMANPCFGISEGIGSNAFDGLRCSVGNVLRHGGRRSDLSGNVGLTNNPWGGEFAPHPGIAQALGGFVSGQTRYFQAVYRDLVTMTCTTGLGTSQAIEIAFTP